MTTLTTPPKTVSHRDEGLLNANISASATSLTVGPIYKWVNGVKTKQGFDSSAGLIEISQGDRYERSSFSSASVDSTTKVTTLSGLTRGISVTSTTPTYGAGTGLSWDKGARVAVVVDEAYLQDAAYQSAANTFTAAQTITAPLLVTGSTSYVGVPSMTTAQRTSLTPTQPGFVYDTDLSQFYKYEGGAWAAVATGSFSNAANGTAGKVDLSTAAEVVAGTANDATSGAPNVIPVSIVKTSSSGAVNGTVPALNASVALDRTIGGLGTTNGTAYGLIANGTSSTGATQTVGTGTSGQVLKSNGSSALPSFALQDAEVLASSIDASTNMDAGTFTTGETYTIAAGKLGTGAVVEVIAIITSNGGTRDLRVTVGGTATATFTSATNSAAGYLHFWLTVRTSTTAWWGGTFQGTTSVASSYASSELAINTANTIAIAIQGQQTGGVETSHLVQQFIVKVHNPQSTQ